MKLIRYKEFINESKTIIGDDYLKYFQSLIDDSIYFRQFTPNHHIRLEFIISQEKHSIESAREELNHILENIQLDHSDIKMIHQFKWVEHNGIVCLSMSILIFKVNMDMSGFYNIEKYREI